MSDRNQSFLGPQDTATFQRDGVLCLRQVLDRRWIDCLTGAIEREIANPGPKHYAYLSKSGGAFHGNQELWSLHPDLTDYCLRSPLPGLAAELLGASKVNLYFDHLFVKEPEADKPTPWHNDQPYWPIKGAQVVSFWTSVDPVTQETGAMEFVRGSHAWDRWFQPRGFSKAKSNFNVYEENPDYEPVPDIEAARADYDIVTWDLEPGDVLAFHSLTLHGAQGNRRLDCRRRGYAVRYCGEDVSYDPRTGTSKLLHDRSLAAGAPLDSARFPVVWRA